MEAELCRYAVFGGDYQYAHECAVHVPGRQGDP
jgi:hypothetical protein